MIIIEANEIPKSVFEWYAQNSNGLLSKTINKFGIVDTILDDVEKSHFVADFIELIDEISRIHSKYSWFRLIVGLE